MRDGAQSHEGKFNFICTEVGTRYRQSEERTSGHTAVIDPFAGVQHSPKTY